MKKWKREYQRDEAACMSVLKITLGELVTSEGVVDAAIRDIAAFLVEIASDDHLCNALTWLCEYADVKVAQTRSRSLQVIAKIMKGVVDDRTKRVLE
jgi:hypothetical protein